MKPVEICWQQISTGFASWQCYCTTSSSGRQPNFTALNRGRNCWGAQNETVSAASGPKFTILWGHVEEILLLNKFFFCPSIHALVEKIYPDKVVRRCPDDNFLASFCVLYFQRAACSTFKTCIINSHCGSMVYIQSATAKIKRGNKKKKKKEEERNRMKI